MNEPSLYYVETIDAEIQKIKSILERRSMAMESAFRPKCFACAKTKQRFSGVIWGNATTVAF
jgi:hypothetical protein